MERIYLDHAATTPMLPEVAQAMEPWIGREFGNPSSLYAEGRAAKDAIDEARESVSESLGCLFAEVIFTSGGTESANLAILGTALANLGSGRRRILMGASEHHCVLNTQPFLERLGFQVEMVPVDSQGRLRLGNLDALLAEDVLLVCAMHANNELGTLQPAREIRDLVRGVGALYFCDAVQTFLTLDGKLAEETGADLLCVSAHKVHGPKGVGALYIRAGTKIEPLMVGGGQERELRAGTENVAGIVGFGEAVRRVPLVPDHRRRARDQFLLGLDIPGLILSVPEQDAQLSGHVHLRIPGVPADSALILLDRMGVGASSGAACSSGSIEPSHVLLACGYSEAEAKEGLRFTFGRQTTVEEAKEAAVRLNLAARRIASGKLGS